MGWNEVYFEKHPLFTNCKQGTDFYFVHSFHFKAAKKENVLATTNYSETITAAVINENIFGTQFHPEKSHENGKKIIENFLDWKP
jgi:glutamine amidotransferase